MTKDVLISIAGLHIDAEDTKGTQMPVEVITPATYYNRNGRHYILYDEVVEGMPGIIKNTVKITGDTMFEIKKSGIANTHMIFEKDRINMTTYDTPFGEMLVGIHTKDIKVQEDEKNIDVHISYALDINNEPLADCEIDVNVKGLS